MNILVRVVYHVPSSGATVLVQFSLGIFTDTPRSCVRELQSSRWCTPFSLHDRVVKER